jgi:hypothetical protein
MKHRQRIKRTRMARFRHEVRVTKMLMRCPALMQSLTEPQTWFTKEELQW